MLFWDFVVEDSEEGVEDGGGNRRSIMSASARYSVMVDGVGFLFEAFRELNAAQEELDYLNELAYDEEGEELDEWEAEIELIKNAPIRVKKSKDKEICVEPVDESNEQAIQSVKQVKQIYSRIKVLNELKQKGYDKVKEQKMPDGSIRLVVQKWQ